jgi:hypothetical protein
MDQVKAWVAANMFITIVTVDDFPDYRPHLMAAVITFRDQKRLKAVV